MSFPDRKIRILIAKVGLDSHDRGAKVIARALRDAGMEVIYTGIRRNPEEIVSSAIEESADVIGISILSGAHMKLVPKVLELLQKDDAGDIRVIVGGTIPVKDIEDLKKLGVREVFTAGKPLKEVVTAVFEVANAK